MWRPGQDSFVAATVNSVLASVLFVLGWLLTLPLWLVPGLSIVLPCCSWPGSTAAPSPTTPSRCTPPCGMDGSAPGLSATLFMPADHGLLAHVPVIGLFVPALAAWPSFAHFGLEALRRSRSGPSSA